ncbi:hypothetical protein NDU88_006465 [Pleurodeles waltl]|uniref:Uncharacterized protein n=1 Tax=Pleurodeles waltl TaxID=8319 RepID=A0AAV7RQ68_PLEWA|nr:hypothetical protein NDU88_006465 [Pleurodeles waltl]
MGAPILGPLNLNWQRKRPPVQWTPSSFMVQKAGGRECLVGARELRHEGEASLGPTGPHPGILATWWVGGRRRG